MKDVESLLHQFFETIMQPIFADIDLSDFDIELEDIPTEEFTRAVLSPPEKYRIPNALLLMYFNDLILPGTTDAQWLLGRTLAYQAVRVQLASFNPQGRPIEIYDRIFICLYVEWCIEVHEMGLGDAITQTAELFNESEVKLNRWYRGGKGAASAERTIARAIIQLFEQLRPFKDQDLSKLVPDSLWKELNEAD